MSKTSLAMGPKEWAILIGLSMLWGGSFFLNEFALLDLSPLTVVWARVTIAAACLWLLIFARGITIPSHGAFWRALILMGLINNALPFTLIVWGQQSIGSGLASILNATMPLFTVLIAGLFLSDERIAPTKLAGVIIGLGGVTIMIGPEHVINMEGTVIAELAILGAAVSYAIATVYGRRFKAMNVSPFVLAAGQVSIASLWLLPLCIINGTLSEFSVATLPSLLAIAGLGMFCTALAYVGYFYILGSSGATNISLVTFLVPVSAILLGSVFLGERLEPIHYVGMGCIALGLASIDGRPVSALQNAFRANIRSR